MPKVALNIFKTGQEYRAVIQVGENPEPISMGKIVYQDGKDVSSKYIKYTREAIASLKEKARKWAREQKILFVHNLDINPYD